MFNVVFYKDRRGREPVTEYLVSLFENNSKNNVIKREKIQEYIDILKLKGTHAGMPFVRHLKGEIWELRPLKDRILFFAYDGNDIILLSHFKKKTQKTPKREIKKAERLRIDYIERRNEDE